MPKRTAQSKTHKKVQQVKATRKAATDGTAKRPVGRPAMFQTPEEMQVKIDAYFASCVPTFLRVDGSVVPDKNGNPIVQYNPPTITGLALYLGFEDRSSLYEYKEKKEFTHTVKKAIARMENYAERELFNNPKPTGAIFWLKNHGWKAEEDTKADVKTTVRFVVEDDEEEKETEDE